MVEFRGYKKQGEDDPNEDPILGAVVFEYSDERLLGVPKGDDPNEVCPCY